MTHLAHAALRRLLLLALTMWCILTIMFALFKLLPGDPAVDLRRQQHADGDDRASEAALGPERSVVAAVCALYRQHGDCSASAIRFSRTRPVSEILLEKVANTCAMIVPALVVSVVLGTVLGALAGWKRGSRFEQTTVTTSLLLHSAPSFFVGILVLMMFSYQLRWLPPGGMVSLGGPGGVLGDGHLARLSAASDSARPGAGQPGDHRADPAGAQLDAGDQGQRLHRHPARQGTDRRGASWCTPRATHCCRWSPTSR